MTQVIKVNTGAPILPPKLGVLNDQNAIDSRVRALYQKNQGVLNPLCDNLPEFVESWLGRSLEYLAKSDVQAAYEKILFLEDLCTELLGNSLSWQEAFSKAIAGNPHLKNTFSKDDLSLKALALKLGDPSFKKTLSKQDTCAIWENLEA